LCEKRDPVVGLTKDGLGNCLSGVKIIPARALTEREKPHPNPNRRANIERVARIQHSM